MRVSRIFAAALLASAMARGEPLSPRVAERYRQMLASNPAEGIVLDRLWQGALEGGTTEELLSAYRNAGNFSGRMIFGLLLRKAGRDDEARAAFEAAVESDAANPAPLLALGRMEMDRVRPREAAEVLEKALAILPKDDARTRDALMQLGAARSAAGDAGKAAAAWERVAALSPEDIELRRRLAQACVDAGQPEIALRHLEFLSQRAELSERAKALQQIAMLHSAAGRTDEAMQALDRAVRGTAPGNWMRAELLGQIIRLAQRAHSEDALEKKWLAQVEANPRDLGCYLQLVEFYDRIGNPEQERAWLGKITALVPGNSEHALRLARLLVQMDELDAAAAQFDRVIAAQPRNTDLVFERARLDLRREDGAAARQRIGAMLQAHRGDDVLRAAALGFFQEHRMLDSVEEQLRENAGQDSEDAVVALAEFYFSQRRTEEGRDVLGRLLRKGDAPAEDARRHMVAAQHLKGHGELSAAIAEVEAAVRLVPESREALLLLGELRSLLAQHSDAKAAFIRAHAASRSDAERLEADGKLFECIRASAQTEGERGRGNLPAAQVEGFIRELMREANDAKSPAGWLRVARWKAWNGDKASAVTFGAKAADMEPANPAAREFLARHAATNGEAAYAVAHLRELTEINPRNRAAYLREIAQIELQRGEHGEALRIFEELVKSNPGGLDALSDLGTAQERAGRFQEAAATWRKALSLASAPRRREVASSLLRVLERIGQHEEATALLLRGVDEATDERVRFSRLDELLLYCQRHALLPWARGVFEKRRKAKADDHVSAIALGRTLKLMGEKAAAFELFADAALSTPNDADVLPELVREAEELRKPALAVRLQEQFLRTAKTEQSDGWLRLASLQENSGDIEGAERSWAKAVAKFPRNADILRRAADFHLQWGDRTVAVALLGKVRALDVTDVRIASELGELQFAAGRLEEARTAFEAVMKFTQPVTALLYPADVSAGTWGWRNAARELRAGRSLAKPGTMSSAGAPKASGSADTGAGGEVQMRLGALRRLAEIARRNGGGALERWVSEWQPQAAGAATEAMWALYFSGVREPVLAVAERSGEEGVEPGLHRQAFIWMALESGMYSRLGAWLNADGRSAEDMEIFSAAFAELLRLKPASVTPAMMRGLFPDGARARLWQCAQELARAKHTREAAALGRRVFDDRASQRASVGRELARWHLALGEAEQARSVLALACEGVGESLDAPLYGAVRDLYFLLPAGQRAEHARERLRGTDEATVHGLSLRVLLFALEGREDEAREALSRLMEMRPVNPVTQEDANSALRELSFARSVASQLIEWNLPRLARHAVGGILADEGLRVLQSQQDVRQGTQPAVWGESSSFRDSLRRMQAQCDALDFLAGGPVERRSILAKLGSRLDASVWPRFAEALESSHGGAHSVAVWNAAWDRDLQNPAVLRKLVEAAQAAGDVTAAETLRRRCFEEHINPGNDTTPREFAIELADLLVARGAAGDALGVIEKAVLRNPEELRLLLRKAQLLERTGQPDEAAALWKRMGTMDGGSAHMRITLASMLEQRGDFAGAIEVRNRTGSSGDTALPELFCKSGQTDEALVALERLAGSSAVQAAMAAAEVLALKGEGQLARRVLLSAAAKTNEPRALMQVRAKLLTIPGLPPSRTFLARMQERMRETAREHPELAGEYHQFFGRYAERFGIAKEWEREVAGAWDGGNGTAASGIAVLRGECTRGDAEAAGRTCEMISERADASDALLGELMGVVHEFGRTDLELAVAERIARRSWPAAGGMLEYVRLLASNGRRGRAVEVLEQHSWLAGFSGGAEALGRAWLSIGDAAMARGFLSQAMSEGGEAPAVPVLAAMAQTHVALNNFAAARLLLRRAFAEPVCHEYAALAAYLDTSDGLTCWREVAEDFGLPARARHELQLAIFALHEKRGRVRDALAMVNAEPQLVSPVGESRGDGALPAVDCGRLRRLAVRTGEFDRVAELLGVFSAKRMPDAEPELEALRADQAERRNARDEALRHVERAAELRPGSWEFARRLAEIRIGRGEPAKAMIALGRFLSVSQSPTERGAALDLWEMANSAQSARKP